MTAPPAPPAARRGRRRRRRLATLAAVLLVATALASVAVASRVGDDDRPRWGARPAGPPPPLGISTGAGLVPSPDDVLADDLDLIASTGVRYVRFDFDWTGVQPDGPDDFEWDELDRAVDASLERDLEIVAMLAYTPDWARPDDETDKHPPLDPAHFARFAGAAAERYTPRGVRVWEIWNEPNVDRFWRPEPDPAAYAELLRGAAAAIRAVDADATIVTGGLSPADDEDDGSGIRPETFLRALYDHGAGDSFTAVGHHPYAFPFHPSVDEPWNAFRQTADLHDVLVEHGDGDRDVWATEVGAPTGSDDDALDEDAQARWLRDYVSLWREWDFAGPFLWYAHRDSDDSPDDIEEGFGLVRHDGTPKPALDAFREVVAAARG